MKNLVSLSIRNTDALRVNPDPKVLQRLRRGYRVSFERYVDLASRGVAQLCINSASCDPLGRLNLGLLHRKENKAHDAYLKARSELVEYIFGAANARGKHPMIRRSDTGSGTSRPEPEGKFCLAKNSSDFVRNPARPADAAKREVFDALLREYLLTLQDREVCEDQVRGVPEGIEREEASRKLKAVRKRCVALRRELRRYADFHLLVGAGASNDPPHHGAAEDSRLSCTRTYGLTRTIRRAIISWALLNVSDPVAIDLEIGPPVPRHPCLPDPSFAEHPGSNVGAFIQSLG